MRKEFYDEVHRRYGDPARFIHNLRNRLDLYGITQAALARRSGFYATHLSAWINGRTLPTMETMVRLDEAMDQLVEWEQEA